MAEVVEQPQAVVAAPPPPVPVPNLEDAKELKVHIDKAKLTAIHDQIDDAPKRTDSIDVSLLAYADDIKKKDKMVSMFSMETIGHEKLPQFNFGIKIGSFSNMLEFREKWVQLILDLISKYEGVYCGFKDEVEPIRQEIRRTEKSRIGIDVEPLVKTQVDRRYREAFEAMLHHGVETRDLEVMDGQNFLERGGRQIRRSKSFGVFVPAAEKKFQDRLDEIDRQRMDFDAIEGFRAFAKQVIQNVYRFVEDPLPTEDMKYFYTVRNFHPEFMQQFLEDNRPAREVMSRIWRGIVNKYVPVKTKTQSRTFKDMLQTLRIQMDRFTFESMIPGQISSERSGAFTNRIMSVAMCNRFMCLKKHMDLERFDASELLDCIFWKLLVRRQDVEKGGVRIDNYIFQHLIRPSFPFFASLVEGTIHDRDVIHDQQNLLTEFFDLIEWTDHGLNGNDELRRDAHAVQDFLMSGNHGIGWCHDNNGRAPERGSPLAEIANAQRYLAGNRQDIFSPFYLGHVLEEAPQTTAQFNNFLAFCDWLGRPTRDWGVGERQGFDVSPKVPGVRDAIKQICRKFSEKREDLMQWYYQFDYNFRQMSVFPIFLLDDPNMFDADDFEEKRERILIEPYSGLMLPELIDSTRMHSTLMPLDLLGVSDSLCRFFMEFNGYYYLFSGLFKPGDQGFLPEVAQTADLDLVRQTDRDISIHYKKKDIVKMALDRVTIDGGLKAMFTQIVDEGELLEQMTFGDAWVDEILRQKIVAAIEFVDEMSGLLGYSHNLVYEPSPELKINDGDVVGERLFAEWQARDEVEQERLSWAQVRTMMEQHTLSVTMRNALRDRTQILFNFPFLTDEIKVGSSDLLSQNGLAGDNPFDITRTSVVPKLKNAQHRWIPMGDYIDLASNESAFLFMKPQTTFFPKVRDYRWRDVSAFINECRSRITSFKEEVRKWTGIKVNMDASRMLK